MKSSRIIYCEDGDALLRTAVEGIDCDRAFLLTDRNVHAAIWREAWDKAVEKENVFITAGGEDSKSIAEAERIWSWLGEQGATRRSLLINLGGGVVTDLGGFCAATFKRGIRFVNVPTTLLGAADAAIGGKTGVNSNGLKNEVGVFAEAERIVIWPGALATLSQRELFSGYAEVVKSAMIGSETLYRRLLREGAPYDAELMGEAMAESAHIKERIVAEDPKEKGMRRVLNFGHTFGHAYEELAMRRGLQMSHGEAVAHGISAALKISEEQLGLSTNVREEYDRNILQRYYDPLPFEESDTIELQVLQMHDKKNLGDGKIHYVLMRGFGDFIY